MYAGSIISPSRDEYVLNACSNRFWFVVELCEAIQAKKVGINCIIHMHIKGRELISGLIPHLICNQ
jgi:hypothetical protein